MLILNKTSYILIPTFVFLIALFFILYFGWDFWENDSEFCTIETLSGRIRGKLNRTLLDERLFYSFRGIPFAKPPVGELRFKAPQPVEPWSDTLDALEFRNQCIEHITGNMSYGFEDCLYLNVYVPTNSTSIDTNAKLPVMIYIYGGSFVSGASNYFSPDFLLEEDVIVVIFNFRMGIFGSLSLNLPEYSGNMGFKDQALALKWVSENIGYFGGDKNQITVCGHSSGAVTVNLHMISPMSSHLFQRAIMLSGSALYSGLIQNNVNRSTLYNFADKMNHSVSNDDELIEFLKNIDGKILHEHIILSPLLPYVPGRKHSIHVWNLVIEDENAVNPFLTKDPFDILTNPSYESHRDTLYGIGAMEAPLTEELQHPYLLKILDDVFEFHLPIYNTDIDFKSEAYKEVAKRIRDFYFDGKSLTWDNLERGHLLKSDTNFLYGIDLCARITAKKSKGITLFSKFSAYNDWNLSARQSKETNYTVKFTDHADQVYYLLWYSYNNSDTLYLNLKSNPMAKAIVKNTAHFYANFVKFGNVMPGIEPVLFKAPNSNEYKYYDITNDGIFVRTDKDRSRMDFWDNLLNDFRRYWNITYDFHELE